MENNSENEVNTNKPRSSSEWVVYILSLVGGYYLFYYLGITGLIFLVAVLGGLFIPNWLFKKYGYKKTLIDIIAWSNLILGLILPPIGVFVAIFPMKFNSLLPEEEKKTKYVVLGILGLIISLCNAVVGVLLRL
jgi:hypothetical protein